MYQIFLLRPPFHFFPCCKRIPILSRVLMSSNIFVFFPAIEAILNFQKRKVINSIFWWENQTEKQNDLLRAEEYTNQDRFTTPFFFPSSSVNHAEVIYRLFIFVRKAEHYFVWKIYRSKCKFPKKISAMHRRKSSANFGLENNDHQNKGLAPKLVRKSKICSKNIVSPMRAHFFAFGG